MSYHTIKAKQHSTQTKSQQPSHEPHTKVGVGDNRVISLSEVFPNDSSNDSDGEEGTSPNQPHSKRKIDSISLIMSPSSPIYQIQIKDASIDESPIELANQKINIQSGLDLLGTDLVLKFDKDLHELESHSQNEHSPFWSMNGNDGKSEVQTLDIQEISPGMFTERGNSAKVIFIKSSEKNF